MKLAFFVRLRRMSVLCAESHMVAMVLKVHQGGRFSSNCRSRLESGNSRTFDCTCQGLSRIPQPHADTKPRPCTGTKQTPENQEDCVQGFTSQPKSKRSCKQ